MRRMRYGLVAHSLGTLLLMLALAMLAPLAWALFYRDPTDITAMLLSMSVTAVAGFTLRAVAHPSGTFGIREGFAVVGLGWIAASAVGALPLLLSGTVACYTDAFFETMSGFTTTGATILTNIEGTPRGVLFWRSLTHWLGGMGIIVLSLALLPTPSGGMSLFQAEVPGHLPERIMPRLKETAALLWRIYAALSAAEILLLVLAGLSLYESLIHTFGTMATGGFSSRSTSIQSFDDWLVEAVIVAFMLLAGLNFALYHRALRRRSLRTLMRDFEARGYLGIIALFAVLTCVVLVLQTDKSPVEALRRSVFQVVSICTTTGFTTDDFDVWPPLAKGVLLLLMFVGGSTGSTGGSVKVARILLMIRYAAREVVKLYRPKLVLPIKSGSHVVEEPVMRRVLGFFVAYLLVFAAGSFVIMATGYDLVTSLAASAATLGNVGPGLGMVGPSCSYAHMPAVAKWTLSFLMLAGRLEIFTVLVLFVPGFWRS